MSDAQLFQAQFTVSSIDDKKYDHCLRLKAGALDSDGERLTLELDINSDLFPVQVEDRIDAMLATTIDLIGGLSSGTEALAAKATLWQEVVAGNKATLADEFDYVCHGKVYRSKESDVPGNLIILISFGGLLMKLDGPSKALINIKTEEVYLLVRKIK